jgi:hypothetical protein
MSEQNLKYVSTQLSQHFTNEGDYATWLDAGMRAIVLDGDTEDTAFRFAEYIIGTEIGAWKKDVGFIYRELPSKHQTYFRAGLAKCIDTIMPEIDANDPARNSGKNLERLAITYLSMAREIKAPEVLGMLVTLIQSKFPRSQAIYDAALLTWRVMADSNTQVDWYDEFCPESSNRIELRYRSQYSTLIAFGMCVARPDKTIHFLYCWPPLRHYIVQLWEEPSPEHLEKLSTIFRAYAQLELRNRSLDAVIPNTPIAIIRKAHSGALTAMSQWLKTAEQQAKNMQRSFSQAANDDSFIGDGMREQPALA